MKRSKTHFRVHCPVEAVQSAYFTYLDLEKPGGRPTILSTSATFGDEWHWDTLEQFWAAFASAHQFHLYHGALSILKLPVDSSLTISIESKDLRTIHEVVRVFEERLIELPPPPRPEPQPEPEPVRVFIGHGRSAQWQMLQNHLRDMHLIDTVAFESGPRAGLQIKDVLQDMAAASSIAFLVHTGEDEGADGRLHARENVIHETGLFQSALGWKRAIVMREDGAAEFSNIHGLVEIRFPRGQIATTFGDVVATIDREFPGRVVGHR